MTYHRKASILLLMTLILLAVTAADTYAAVQDPSAWRVELTPTLGEQANARATGFWTGIRLWLSGKAAKPRPPIGTTYTVTSSAYAPSPYQTDATPCVTAAGTRVRDGVVASNFLPLGTILSINDKLYIVEDRMNSRFQSGYIDLWFPSTSAALEFGRRKLQVTVVGYGTPGQALVEDKPATGKPLQTVAEPTLLQRANLRFVAATRVLSRYILTNVNRHDVDCFAAKN